MPGLIVILGATGAGKTRLAIDLALEIERIHSRKCEIINADVLQCYAGSPIVTNKATTDEQKGIPHHLIGFADPFQNMKAHSFRDEASEVIRDLDGRGRQAIVVGGSDYYVKALVSREFDISQVLDGGADEVDGEASLEQSQTSGKFEALSKEAMHELLEEVDPLSAGRLHPNDTRRVRRYLEICETSGKAASALFLEQRRSAGECGRLLYDCFFIVVDTEDGTLERHVSKRVDEMLERGLISEVANLYALCPNTRHGIMQAIGVSEFEQCDLSATSPRDDETVSRAIEDMKANTIRLARKQRRRMLRWLTKCNLETLTVDTTSALKARYLEADCNETQVSKPQSFEEVWRSDVLDPCVNAVSAFLSKDPQAPPRKIAREDVNLDWQSYQCSICGGRRLQDQHAWDAHRAGRQHRRRLATLRKRHPGCTFQIQPDLKGTGTLVFSLTHDSSLEKS